MASYRIRWLVEHKVVQFQLIGKYDFAVAQEAMIKLDDDLSQMTPPVYLINDMIYLTDFARKFRELFDEMGQRRNYDRIVWTLIITPNPIIRFFGSAAANMFHVKFRAVTSLGEAVEVLMHIDPSLEQLGDINLSEQNVS